MFGKWMYVGVDGEGYDGECVVLNVFILCWLL